MRPLLAFERKASATIQNHLQQDQAKRTDIATTHETNRKS